MLAKYTNRGNAALEYNTHTGLIIAGPGLNTRAEIPRSKSVRYILSDSLLFNTSQPRNFSYFLTHRILRFSHYPLSILTLSDPTSDLVRQYYFPVLLRCRKTSDTVFVAFVRPLSEPVRRFSSRSTDFNQQIAQVVLFLFPHVFPFQNCKIITSNPPTSFPPKTNKSWGVCGWRKNWIGKS
jgi:hypothetical protein